MKCFLALTLFLFVYCAPPTYAQQRRVALVIGNSSYAATAPLKNPANDARDMAAVLTELGFEIVNRRKMVDLAHKDMLAAIQAFGQKIRGGGVGLFYYAGHGMQVNGANFLIPVDAKINNEGDVKYQGIDASDILTEMENANNGVNILILDACRNNPFARSYRSGNVGLAQMNAPSGTLIAYATAPGSVASDGGDGRNGLYTKELIGKMRTPGLPIEEVFKRVRVSVRDKTQRAQTPWESTSLDASFFFIPGSAAIASEPQPSAKTIDKADAEQEDPMEAVRKWGSGGRTQSVGDTGHVGVYKNMNDSNSNLQINSDGTFNLRQALRPGQYNQFVGNYLIEDSTLVLLVDVARSPRGMHNRMKCAIVDNGFRCHDGTIYMKR